MNIEVLGFAKENKLQVVARRVDASVFVVANPAFAGDRIEWAAALRGGYVATPKAFLQRRGATIQYKVGTKQKRRIWMSKLFQKKCPGISAIIKQVVRSQTKGKTYLINSKATFVEAKERAVRRRRPYEVLGIVTKKQKRTLLSVPRKLTDFRSSTPPPGRVGARRAYHDNPPPLFRTQASPLLW